MPADLALTVFALMTSHKLETWQECSLDRKARTSGQTKQAQRASKSGLNWLEGPLHQDQTGPSGQYIMTKLARRASKSGLNLGQYVETKLGPNLMALRANFDP